MPSPFSNPFSLPPDANGLLTMKFPAVSARSVPLTHPKASRRWFAALLWQAFPSRSAGDLAERAAPVLGVSTRQVRNWLDGEHDAALRHVLAVIAIAGAEVVFKERNEK